MPIPQYVNFGTNLPLTMADCGAPSLYLIKLQPSTKHYTVMKARMKVTIVPNTVDAYVSGILIDDEFNPSHYNF